MQYGDSLILDDGTITICRLENRSVDGNMPKPVLVKVSSTTYGERIIGYGRQYAAKGVAEQIDMLVRIWQDRTVRIGMRAVIEGEQYRIQNVQHLYDKAGLKVTDLSLQRMEEFYELYSPT